MSAPHYYNAYPALINQIDGIDPNQEKHDTFIDIEPRTGVAMSAHKRIQVWKSKGAAPLMGFLLGHCPYNGVISKRGNIIPSY